MTTSKPVTVYTDGACSGNPGPGGWGAILMYEGQEKPLSGYDPETTNNRMELMAVIEALGCLKRASRVELYTDSTYVMKGVTEWMAGWKRNGWKTSARKPVKNQDLWQRMSAAIEGHDIRWHWVKGHSGDHYNDMADELARQEITRRHKHTARA